MYINTAILRLTDLGSHLPSSWLGLTRCWNLLVPNIQLLLTAVAVAPRRLAWCLVSPLGENPCLDFPDTHPSV